LPCPFFGEEREAFEETAITLKAFCCETKSRFGY